MASEATVDDRDSGAGHLIQRAYVFLNRLGRPAAEEEMVRCLFGAQTNYGAWLAPLEAVLGASPLFSRTPNGDWALAGRECGEAAGGDYLVLSLQTTGLRPSRHRLLDIAIKRYSGGEAVGAFASLINPGRRLPRFVTRTTGITDEMCEEAPQFAEVADVVLEFAGFLPIVAHDAEAQVGFLNYELRRAGRRPILNPRSDVLQLCVERMPDLGKPSLDRIAQALHLPFPHRPRAGDLVDLTALIHSRLSEMEDGEDRPGQAPGGPRPSMGLVARRPQWLDALPDGPGAYIMRNARGDVLYVGKGKNIRERVSSYYSVATPANRRLEGLLTAIEHVEALETGTEEEALAEESRLIEEYRPPYNVQRRRHESRPVLWIDTEELFPRLQSCRSVGEDSHLYFGPFAVADEVRDLRSALTGLLGLRTCKLKFDKRRRKPIEPCRKLNAGECLGPCAGLVSVEEYKLVMDDAIRFLQGDREALLNRAWEKLREAKARQSHARASKIRGWIEYLEGVDLPGGGG